MKTRSLRHYKSMSDFLEHEGNNGVVTSTIPGVASVSFDDRPVFTAKAIPNNNKIFSGYAFYNNPRINQEQIKEFPGEEMIAL